MSFVQTCPFKTDIHLERQVCKAEGSHGGQTVCAEARAGSEQDPEGVRARGLREK